MKARRRVLVAGCALVVAAGCGETGYRATLDTDLEVKPQIQVPEGEPPAELVVDDVVPGHGTAVSEGVAVTVHYVGVSWSQAQQFDSSWEGAPATFHMNDVIAGWQEGLIGMRVGGRRSLVIPPDLGYGDDTLIFVIDLLEVE